MGYRGHFLLKKLLGGHVPPVPPLLRRLCNRSMVFNFFFILFLVNWCFFFPVFRTYTFCRDDKHIHFNRKTTAFPYNCSLRSLRPCQLQLTSSLMCCPKTKSKGSTGQQQSKAQIVELQKRHKCRSNERENFTVREQT